MGQLPNARGNAVLVNAMAAAAKLTAFHTQARPPQQQPPPKKMGRNDPCYCGSGRKFKDCHLARRKGIYERDPKRLPKPRELDEAELKVATSVAAPTNKNATAIAMMNAGVSERVVWAYLETGHFITEINKAAHPAKNIEAWEAALAAYDAATPEDRKIMMSPALPGDV